MKDEEIRLLLLLQPVMFADGENCAIQVARDVELGVMQHVRIPSNGFPASEYGEPAITYQITATGEEVTWEEMRLRFLPDPEKRAIMEARELQYRQQKGEENVRKDEDNP